MRVIFCLQIKIFFSIRIIDIYNPAKIKIIEKI